MNEELIESMNDDEELPQFMIDYMAERALPKRHNSVKEFEGYISRWIKKNEEYHRPYEILSMIIEKEKLVGNDLSCLKMANNISSAMTCVGQALIKLKFSHKMVLRPNQAADEEYPKSDKYYRCSLVDAPQKKRFQRPRKKKIIIPKPNESSCYSRISLDYMEGYLNS